jgi:hypothetical protein
VKEAMVLFGDEVEVRDQYVGVIAQGFVIKNAIPHRVVGIGTMVEEYNEAVTRVAGDSFDLAEALIRERRRRTTYTCASCGKAALKPGDERCPECATHMCVRCRKPAGETHHLCIAEVKGASL